MAEQDQDQHPCEIWRRKILSFPKSMICDDEDSPLFYVNAREQAACKWLADELRKLADHVESDESDNWPKVFGCSVPDKGPTSEDHLMVEYRVILSHPWGG